MRRPVNLCISLEITIVKKRAISATVWPIHKIWKDDAQWAVINFSVKNPRWRPGRRTADALRDPFCRSTSCQISPHVFIWAVACGTLHTPVYVVASRQHSCACRNTVQSVRRAVVGLRCILRCVLQVWAKGAKPPNAAEGDVECKESTWGVGANINTRLVNPAGEVCNNPPFNIGSVNYWLSEPRLYVVC